MGEAPSAQLGALGRRGRPQRIGQRIDVGNTPVEPQPLDIAFHRSQRFRIEEVCAFDYATPKVAMTSLSNSAQFVAVIDQTKPQGGTPTLPAMKGAVTYAEKIAGERPLRQ